MSQKLAHSVGKSEKKLEPRVLGSLADFEQRLDCATSDLLAKVHFALYGKFTSANLVKKNLRQFGGFSFSDSEFVKHVKTMSESFSLVDLKAMASFFKCEGVDNADASHLAKTILQAAKSAVKDETAVKSRAFSMRSRSSIRSSSHKQKSNNTVDVEILKLKDKELEKEMEIVELESEVSELKKDEETNKDIIAEKEAKILTSKTIQRLLSARIKNKEALKTISDIAENESVVSDASEANISENATAQWVENHSVHEETDDKNIRQIAKSINSMLSRQTVGNNLMKFDGSSSLLWPIFLNQYEVSSELCGFSNKENILRLDNSLAGEARQCVELLLCAAKSPDEVLEILKTKYGRPELIADEIRRTISNTARVTNSASFMDFSFLVRNISAVADEELRKFVDERQILALFLGKLPEHLLTQWGAFLISNRISRAEETLKHFAQWSREMAEVVSRTFPTESPSTESRNRIQMADSNKSPQCKVCNIANQHSLERCSIFKSFDVKRRWRAAEKVKACYCCLQFHNRGNCNNRKLCPVDECAKFHHPLLHKNSVVPSTSQVLSYTTPDSKVLLKIVAVKLRGPLGTLIVKAILDEGSTATLIESSVAKLLGMKGEHKPFCCRWTGGKYQFENDSYTIQAEIAAKGDNSKFNCLKDVRTVNNLNLPNQQFNVEKLAQEYPYIQHVGEDIGNNEQPVLLIGQNNANLIVSRQIIHPQGKGPVLSKTALGWTIHGAISQEVSCSGEEITFFCCDADESLHQTVKRYFTLENFGTRISKPSNQITADENRAIQIAKDSIKLNNRRYEVAIPWKSDKFEFPNSRPMAERRLHCLKNRLRSNKAKSDAYSQEIQKLIASGYAVPVTPKELSSAKRVWYLPHFAVTNPNKPGKVRIVFDAAAKVDGKLNDYILTGPDLLIPLFRILCQFRQHKIAFTADIREMFNRIEIKDEDSYSQCFLWNNEVFRMKAMLFGTASSPFLAQVVKNYNAEKHRNAHEAACEAILKSHYVDDYLHGTESTADEIKIINDVIYVHSKGGFEIRNFVTNSEEVRNSLPSKYLAKQRTSEIDKYSQQQRVLEMLWNASEDTFAFNLGFRNIENSLTSGEIFPTKRQVLKIVITIFDPLGLLTPFTIKPKLLLQDIWWAGIGWDDNISSSMMDKWKMWHIIKRLKIPRHLVISGQQVEIFNFNDASESAYASVVYIRVKQNEEYITSLVAAKARVAPLKSQTIPKLELLAAVMGVRLTAEVINALNLNSSKKYYWTDSRTVLHWLNSKHKLTSFVAVRVGEILEKTEINEWFWVPTNLNCADICTREKHISDFSNESAWFKGPEFMREDMSKWPKQQNDTQVAEEIVNLLQLENAKMPLPSIKFYYSWTRVLRTTAWIRRFIWNAKHKQTERINGEITAEELRWSEMQWQKSVQQSCFPEDLRNVRLGISNKSGKLRNQLLKIDETEILHVNGRISNAEQVIVERDPIVLDGKHEYVKLMIMHYHKAYNHQGTETVINELKRKYWIPHVRTIVKNVIYNCFLCKKRRVKPVQPQMGILPRERLLLHEKPFTATGVDFFGPFQVKVGRRTEKRYGVLFTCLTVRAIHVEITHSLTSDACILAIRRFLSRRGEVKTFWSDNGTNFRGASRELLEAYEEMNESELRAETTLRKIEWNFIPPASPHMGGAWERLIGCFKRAPLAIMNDRNTTDEILATVFAEAEYIVNNRPLTYVSNDAADKCSITPNDILIGRSGYVRCPGVFNANDLLLRRQWRVSQALVDLFWKRWLREYLPTIIGRNKWSRDTPNLQQGDLVIINDNQLPRGEWPLGVVISVIPGTDGKVRVAEVKTRHGIYRRPVTKLHRLDVCVDDGVNTGGGMSL